jgi:flagellar basal body rod protein FlgG
MFHIYNDQSIEIIAGQKSSTTGVDIVITGKNGDIWITAEKNGQVRIRGANITVDADENLTLKAGNNVRIEAGNKIDLKSNIANCDALAGNLAPVQSTFMDKTFKGTYVRDLAQGSLGGFL